MHNGTLKHAWRAGVRPVDPWADRKVRFWRWIDGALPWAFRASIGIAFAAAIWGALGGPLP